MQTDYQAFLEFIQGWPGCSGLTDETAPKLLAGDMVLEAHRLKPRLSLLFEWSPCERIPNQPLGLLFGRFVRVHPEQYGTVTKLAGKHFPTKELAAGEVDALNQFTILALTPLERMATRKP